MVATKMCFRPRVKKKVALYKSVPEKVLSAPK
jgi:hypothetical protein